MTRLFWLLGLGFLAFSASAKDSATLTVEEEVKALRGWQYLLVMHGQKVASHLSCTDQGGSSLTLDGVDHEGWSEGLVECQGRWVVTLKRHVGMVERHAKWRIVDALLIPSVPFDPDRKKIEGLELTGAEECEIKGRPNTALVVLARFGKRDRIDWRTGVEKAWTFDVKRGRIVPLSTKRIVCEAYEP